MKKLLAILMALILFAPMLAIADDEPSPSLPHQTTMVSSGMAISEFPIDCMPIELMRIDLNISAVRQNGYAEAYVGLFYLPDDLAYVLLTDGFHIVYGEFERYVDDILYVRFDRYDLEILDGTMGLWLVLIQQIE